MALRDVWRRITRREGQTTETGTKRDRTLFFDNVWQRFFTRKRLWQDLEDMDSDMPPVSRGFDFISRYATQLWEDGPELGFSLEGGDEELAILDPAARMLQDQAFEHTRSMVKFGDMFAEVVVDRDGVIQNAKMFPYAYQIEINVNPFGGLMSGDPSEAMTSRQRGIAAYEQVDDNGSLVAAFWPYQIVHFSFGHRQGLRYTEPHLACAISLAKRLRAIQDGLTIARMTRSVPRMTHKIPIPIDSSKSEAEAKISDYRDRVARDITVPYDTTAAEFHIASRESPPLVDTAFYIPRLYTPDGSRIIDGAIESITADNPYLENLDDVYMLFRELLCAIGVPVDYLNLAVGQKSFIDRTTPEKREAFLYLAKAVQSSYIRGVKQILDLQLLLAGRNPLTARYAILPPRISPREAEVAANIDLKRGQTAAMWQKLGIPSEVIGTRVLQMTTKELDAWLAAFQSGAAEPEEAPETKEPQLEAWSEYAQMQFAQRAGC